MKGTAAEQGCLHKEGERSGNQSVDALGIEAGAGLQRLGCFTGELDARSVSFEVSATKRSNDARASSDWIWKNSAGYLASASDLTASDACSMLARYTWMR